MTTESSDLSAEQRARKEALATASNYTQRGDTADLHSIAQWVIDGENPWPTVTAELVGRTDPDIAVTAVLDAVNIEVRRLDRLRHWDDYVSLEQVIKCLADALPIKEGVLSQPAIPDDETPDFG